MSEAADTFHQLLELIKSIAYITQGTTASLSKWQKKNNNYHLKKRDL